MQCIVGKASRPRPTNFFCADIKVHEFNQRLEDFHMAWSSHILDAAVKQPEANEGNQVLFFAEIVNTLKWQYHQSRVFPLTHYCRVGT